MSGPEKICINCPTTQTFFSREDILPVGRINGLSVVRISPYPPADLRHQHGEPVSPQPPVVRETLQRALLAASSIDAFLSPARMPPPWTRWKMKPNVSGREVTVLKRHISAELFLLMNVHAVKHETRVSLFGMCQIQGLNRHKWRTIRIHNKRGGRTHIDNVY